MSRKKNQKNDKGKKNKNIRVKSGRADKKIVDQFTRKFRNVIQSSGIDAAEDWLKRGPTREIGRRLSSRRTIVLPMKKMEVILAESRS